MSASDPLPPASSPPPSSSPPSSSPSPPLDEETPNPVVVAAYERAPRAWPSLIRYDTHAKLRRRLAEVRARQKVKKHLPGGSAISRRIRNEHRLLVLKERLYDPAVRNPPALEFFRFMMTMYDYGVYQALVAGTTRKPRVPPKDERKATLLLMDLLYKVNPTYLET